jgi:hypothetical protein
MMTWHQGFFEIDLDKVSAPTVNSWGTKDSLQDIREWMLHVKEIQLLCQEKGFTTADFQRLQSSASKQEVEIYKTYSHLYELSRSNIKVVWEDSHYSIENGNHRILIAKQMRLRHLPAQVKASSLETLVRLKNYSDQIARFEKPLTPAQKLEWFKQVRAIRVPTQVTSNRRPTLGQ